MLSDIPTFPKIFKLGPDQKNMNTTEQLNILISPREQLLLPPYSAAIRIIIHDETGPWPSSPEAWPC